MPYKPKPCARCETVFEPTGHNAKFCESCRSQACEKYSSRFPLRQCERCTDSFTPLSSTTKYCARCRPLAAAEYQKAYREAHHRRTGYKVKACERCGAVFTPRNSGAKYCEPCRPIINSERCKEYYKAHPERGHVRRDAALKGIYALSVQTSPRTLCKFGKGDINMRLMGCRTFVTKSGAVLLAYTEINDEEERDDAEKKILNELNGLLVEGETTHYTPEVLNFIHTHFEVKTPINVDVYILPRAVSSVRAKSTVISP